MQTELLSLISRTTQQLITLSAPNEPQILPNLGTGNSFSSPRQPSPIQTSILLDLLQIVFDQLRQVLLQNINITLFTINYYLVRTASFVFQAATVLN